jgi:fucose permease
LTRRVPTGPLLLTAAVIVAVGFPVFWLARSPGVALTGLFILGLGVANLFPFTLSAATSVAPGMANTASARVSMGGGLAILVTPQILGSAADQIGIQWAFGIAGLLCVGVLVIAFVAQRAPAHGGG